MLDDSKYMLHSGSGLIDIAINGLVRCVEFLAAFSLAINSPGHPTGLHPFFFLFVCLGLIPVTFIFFAVKRRDQPVY